MTIVNFAHIPGHHQFVIEGPNGNIEIGLSIPQLTNHDFFAIVGHPHPLQEGTMNNKVVTTTAKKFVDMHIPVIRFNFRGVGASQGVFDHGIGETDDMLYLIGLWKALYPQSKLILSGFSFGSYVAARAAQVVACALLVLIAPPVARFQFQPQSMPSVILMGDADEVVDPQDVRVFAESVMPPIPIEWFADTGHFFHGKLLLLKDVLDKWVNTCLTRP